MVVLAAPSVYADARSDAKAQVEFGIAVAQRGLWREALYRWQRAVELDPDNLMILQNYELFREINDRATRDR